MTMKNIQLISQATLLNKAAQVGLLTSHRDYTHVSSPAVHFRAEEPAVLIYRVTLNAAKWVT